MVDFRGEMALAVGTKKALEGTVDQLKAEMAITITLLFDGEKSSAYPPDNTEISGYPKGERGSKKFLISLQYRIFTP